MSLKGKVALVTGAASGIGRECVLNMSAKGAKVVIADLSLEQGNLVVDEIKKAGGEAMAVSMQRHWSAGLTDLSETLADPTCLNMPAEGENFVTYDVHRKARFTAESPDPMTEQNVLAGYAFESTHDAAWKSHQPNVTPHKISPTHRAKASANKPAAKATGNAAVKPMAKKTATKR